MELLPLIVILIIVGAVLALVPMDQRIKNIIYVIVAVAVCLWLLSFLGVVPHFGRLR